MYIVLIYRVSVITLHANIDSVIRIKFLSSGGGAIFIIMSGPVVVGRKYVTAVQRSTQGISGQVPSRLATAGVQTRLRCCLLESVICTLLGYL